MGTKKAPAIARRGLSSVSDVGFLVLIEGDLGHALAAVFAPGAMVSRGHAEVAVSHAFLEGADGSIEFLKILLASGREIENFDLGFLGLDELDHLESLLLLPRAFPVKESIDGQLETVLVSQFIGLGRSCGGLELDEQSAGADEVEVADDLRAVAGGFLVLQVDFHSFGSFVDRYGRIFQPRLPEPKGGGFLFRLILVVFPGDRLGFHDGVPFLLESLRVGGLDRVVTMPASMVPDLKHAVQSQPYDESSSGRFLEPEHVAEVELPPTGHVALQSRRTHDSRDISGSWSE